MGFLTTFTVLNDTLVDKLKDPQGLYDKIKAHAGAGHRAERIHHEGLQLTAQMPRHADVNVVYFHTGGMVIEMSPYSEETKRFAEVNPEAFAEAVKYLRETAREIERKYGKPRPKKKRR